MERLSFCWVPGHVGIRGNERADIAAKLATVGPPEFMLLHFSYWIPCIRKAMMTKWNGIWSARKEKMRDIRPEVEKWDIDNLLNRRDEVIINRLRSGHTWITHEYLINDIVQTGPEPCPFCNNAVKSVKHFITECEDLIILRNEVFESEIGRNVFNMRGVDFCEYLG